MSLCYLRDRPAAIPVSVKSIDDTSNFDDFPDIDLKWRKAFLHCQNSVTTSVTNLLSFLCFNMDVSVFSVLVI